MQKIIDLVLDWRSAFGLLVDGGGGEADINLALNLIREELHEYIHALSQEDRIEQLDALGDLFFVVVQLECMHRKPVFDAKSKLPHSLPTILLEILLFKPHNFSSTLKSIKSETTKLGVDLYDLVQEIYNSNMSKLCKDEQTAKESVENYKNKGVETYYKTCTTDSSKYIVYRREDNKVLKSVDFVEPDIQKLLH